MAGWTEDDVGDLTGRTALVTGANSGIGWDTARVLAERGAHVVLACRNPTKAADARDRILAGASGASVEVLELDVSEPASVRSAATAFRAAHDRLDLLVNNAGIMAVPLRRNSHGWELQLATNHLGHFLLTAELADRLLTTPGSRVVNVASLAHRGGKIAFDDLEANKRYAPMARYCQSKLANLLFSSELQRRLAGAGASTIALSAHPGLSRTNLAQEPANAGSRLLQKARPLYERMIQPSAMGALPTLRAAVDPTARGDEYFGPGGFGEYGGHPDRARRSARSQDRSLAARLWDVSLSLTGASYPF
jgi:NAD(P)-dependent dehydrogenase (short-subunit alcohol dehydrogenase family)